ncbi:hypothetical protein LWI29_013421 [Acer saccharum]|uniref:NB-ARC domain-containing protein n=1 Tax=Acer saccharum TaxID=4024 RepID=A0AA39W8X2_ACESA|nr:hypothetical protein LWI29_013421 [Acer saccharum]
MPTFSGEMELRWSGLNSHGQRRYERNFELLKQKTEYLYDMRDSVRDEQIKELMLGTIPSKESHKWLKKERDLQPRLNHLLIFHRERHEDLITTLDEVTHHLENFPFSTIGAKTYGVFEKAKKTKAETKGQSDFIVNARDKEAARSAKFVASLDELNPVLGHETGMGHDDVGFKPVQDGFTRIFDDDSVAQSQDRATGRKTKNVKHEIKADTRDESAVEVVAQGKKATQRLKGKLAVEKDGRFEAQKSDVMAVKHRGSSLGDIEYQSEIVPAAVTKSVLDADQVPASSIETVIEDEKMRPQQSYTSPLDEYEIQRIHEREGELNVPLKGSVGENRRMLPIHETVPSQPEVESQMNVNQSVGPVETFKAGPSNTTAVEPAPASPFRKKDEIPPVIELSSITEGDVKTSTGRTVLKILGYMNDVTAGKVGVHGIGGIGKTSVLEALINHNETKSIFDSIMFVSVSRYWSIRKIQNEVLRQLSLSHEDSETDTQVAESLFSKDREVTIFELIEYCIQEGVIDGSGGDVHKRGLDIVNDLKRASLLQDTKDDNSIKMHDLIRDLALGILSSVAEGSQYLLRTGSLKEPSNPASSLPPPENSRLNIPEVKLPSEVCHLKHLEVLDLQGTEINKLPVEIGELTSLRHLKVSFYGSIDYNEYVKLPQELISSGILSRLKALETLSIVVYPGDQRWYKNVKYVVTDISNLTDLSSLCFHFPEVELLEPFLKTSEAWNSRRLTEFKFVIGHDVKSITSRVPNFVECDYYRQGQCLRFVNGEKISDAVRKVLARSTAFYLDHHLTICSLSDFGVSNINGLKLCIISECPKMETVVDGKELTMTVFSSLENLRIYYLWNLTSIWEGSVPKGSFAGLKILSLCACPKLKNVFSSSMIDFVSKLEELVVEDCPSIEEIVLEGDIIGSDCILLPSLKKLTLHDLPELVNIWKSAWPSLEHISFYNCPKLKKIGWNSELKRTIREIEAEKSWWDELEWEDTDLKLELQDHLATICEDDP